MLSLFGGTDWTGGARIILRGKDHTDVGAFIIDAVNDNENCRLIGLPNAILKWDGFRILTEGAPSYRKRNTPYNVGDITYHYELPGGYYLECTTAGTTNMNSILTINLPSIGKTIIDGTVTWTIFSEQQNYKNLVETNDANILNEGSYYCDGNALNTPESGNGIRLLVYNTQVKDNLIVPFGGTIAITYQLGITNAGNFYIRTNSDGIWNNWKQVITKDIALDSINLNVMNGYIHFGNAFNKFIIQWGLTYIANANITTKINLNINMNTGGGQVYPVFMTNVNTTTMNSAVIDNDRYQSYFNIISSSSGYYYWLVMGL